MRSCLVFVFVFVCLINIDAWTVQQNAWVAMTKGDLQAIHDLLMQNHPGPVDPQNPRYGKWLRAGLEEVSRQAESAASFSDYVRCLQYYTNGFQDGHIGIGLEVDPDRVAWPGFIVE